jgi:hypothetical protein
MRKPFDTLLSGIDNDLETLRSAMSAIDHYFIISNRTLFNLAEIYFENHAGITSTVETITADLNRTAGVGHRNLVH